MTEIPCSKPCSTTLVCRRVARDGVVYRCAQVLADTLGVTRHAVYQSLYRNGTADRVGKSGPGGNNRHPVTIGRHRWPSISHMARDLGMNRSHIDKLFRRDAQRLLAIVMKVKG